MRLAEVSLEIANVIPQGNGPAGISWTQSGCACRMQEEQIRAESGESRFVRTWEIPGK